MVRDKENRVLCHRGTKDLDCRPGRSPAKRRRAYVPKDPATRRATQKNPEAAGSSTGRDLLSTAQQLYSARLSSR